MSSHAMTAVSTTTPEDVLVATAVAAAQAEEDASNSIPPRELADHYVETKVEAANPVQTNQGQEGHPTGKLTKPRARKSPGSGAKRSETSKRKFICSFSHYGCDTTLSSKNEWKRHVSIQHLQLGFYRCDVGSCNPNNNPNTPPHKKVYNDFNRKDLFTQHHRRMHKPETGPGSALQQDPNSSDWRAFEDSLEEVRNRCWHEKRKPPSRSTCGFCGRTFEGEGSWNERMEHVGGHYSRDLPEACREEREDEDLTNWALQENIVKEAPNGRHVLVDQPASAIDKPFSHRNVDTTMSDAPPISPTNGQGIDGNFLGTEDFRRTSFPSAYPPLNGTGRPGSSSGQHPAPHPLRDQLHSSPSSWLNFAPPLPSLELMPNEAGTDRLEDLINTLINPKKPRMSKRLQWRCVSSRVIGSVACLLTLH